MSQFLQKLQNLVTKNLWVTGAAGLMAIVLTLSSVYFFRTPAREISKAEFERLATARELKDGQLAPTPFAAIYSFEARHKAKDHAENVYLSTRLEDYQVRQLLESGQARLDLPGTGLRAQWINIISTLIIAGVVITLVVYQTSIGKGRNTHVRQRPSVTFNDVAGIEEAKNEVTEIVDFLRDARKYRRLGGKLPKGVLLIGPPGSGKTMLAKAIASEAKANFFSAHGSDFTEVFLGVGAKRVRQLFRQAARNKPAIIFIDEIDCVGRNRKFDTHSEHQQTINALLAAMDGFESSEGIVVVAATNRPEDLDDALTRPGRFDRKVHVPYPDMKGRRQILETHSAEKPIAERQKALEAIAQTTPGMSGADLANLLNEAAIASALKNAGTITLVDLEAARDKVRFGQERKSMVLKQKEREMVAYHEAGHTIVHLRTSLLPPLYKVSIVPRGGALGVTTLLPDEDQNLQSKKFLLEELLVLMGGRAAEKTFYDSTTNGAAGDLDMARKVARKMIHEWGMGEKMYYEPEKSDAEAEINRLLATADRQAHEMIVADRDKTEKLAKALLERETLGRDDVLALVG
jgi:cell division protease FtsH